MIEIPDAEADAVRHALGDYLAPYIDPQILGPTPSEDTQERLVSMARAYLRTFDYDDSVVLSMGDWTAEVSL